LTTLWLLVVLAVAVMVLVEQAVLELAQDFP
jgi:hypothetical protein